MSPVMRATLRGMLRALLAAGVLPSPSEAQVRGPDDAAVDAYYQTVGHAFSVSVEELRILGEWGLAPEEITVVLFVARRAGVSPDVIAMQRGGRAPWASIVLGHGISAGVFHVVFPPGTTLGPLDATYKRFADTPRESWDTVPLDDEALIALVNIRVLSGFFRVPESTVLAAWERTGNLVLAHGQLLSPSGR